jgi:hypothetical protein
VQSSNAQTLNAQTSNVNVGDTLLSTFDIPISENSSKNFFKRKNAQSSNAQTSNAQISNVNVGDTSSPASDIPISENSSKRLRRVNGNEFNISLLEYDHGLRRQI